MTLSDHNPEMFTPPTKYHLLCLQADAFFYCSQYKQAEVNLAANLPGSDCIRLYFVFCLL